MKRYCLIILLVFVAFISNAADRTLSIKNGYTQLNTFNLNASDTINESDTVNFTITNAQKYFQHQVFTIGLDSVSGAPNVTVKAYGKVTASQDYTQIGSTVTWYGTSEDTSFTISSTSPYNYNYLKVEYIATSTNQQSKVTTFEAKTANMYDIPASSGTLTISRATSGAVTITTKDNDANAATTYRAGGTGALTIGAATGTTAITSSDWAIGATGAMTGIGAITNDGLITASAGATITGAAINLNASSNFAVNVGTGSTTAAVSIGGGSNTVAVNSSAWDISTAGAVSGVTTIAASGEITATGGLALATQPTVYWAAGGAVALATAGTDVACANGTRFWVEVNIPYNSTITGLSYLIGSVGGTDSVVVQLCNSSGVQVATSRSVGGAAAIVGTAANMQSVAFTTPYAAVAGRYFAVVQFNGTTAKFRAYPIPGSKFIANTAAGTWGTAANITPGTTFVADKGPIISTY